MQDMVCVPRYIATRKGKTSGERNEEKKTPSQCSYEWYRNEAPAQGKS
jgi:hypothetical protein